MLTFLLGIGLLAAEIRLDPAVIGSCRDGLGTARVHWSADPAAGPVTVLAGGVPMTALEPPAGTARTGDWVSDGLEFVLIDRTGAAIARTSALVDCGRTGTSQSYWPLDAGNRWIYRVNHRQATGVFEVQEVTGAERIGGTIYFTVEPGSRKLREDGAGRILERTRDGDRIIFDPAAAERQPARSTPLGDFDDVLRYRTPDPFAREFRTFARGIGLVDSEASLIAGSSGGFLISRTLVEVFISGRHLLREPLKSPTIEIESDRLDVSGRRVANCAVPCYFAACGLGPGADPPGTYKPCTRVRTEWPGLDGTAELTIEDDAGRVTWRAQSRAALQWISAPLYERPNEPLPPGRYWLRLRSGDRETRTAIRID